TGRLIERPPFAALAAVCSCRAIEILALADVEAREMTARRQCRPDDTVTVDVDAARIEPRLRHFEDLGHARRRRIAAALQPNQVPGEALAGAPDRVVH